MTRKFNKVSVIIITILLSELINAYLLSLLNDYKDTHPPYLFVALLMGLSVCIFYPAIAFLNKYLRKSSNKYFHKSARFAGGNLKGSVIGLALAIFLIYIAMLQILFQKNAITDSMAWLFNH